MVHSTRIRWSSGTLLISSEECSLLPGSILSALELSLYSRYYCANQALVSWLSAPDYFWSWNLCAQIRRITHWLHRNRDVPRAFRSTTNVKLSYEALFICKNFSFFPILLRKSMDQKQVTHCKSIWTKIQKYFCECLLRTGWSPTYQIPV